MFSHPLISYMLRCPVCLIQTNPDGGKLHAMTPMKQFPVQMLK